MLGIKTHKKTRKDAQGVITHTLLPLRRQNADGQTDRQTLRKLNWQVINYLKCNKFKD